MGIAPGRPAASPIVTEFERARIVDASGQPSARPAIPAISARIRKTGNGYALACLSRRDPLIEFLKTEPAFVDAHEGDASTPRHWIAPRASPEFAHDFPIELGATRLFGEIKPWAPSVLLRTFDRAQRRAHAGRLGAFARRRAPPRDIRRPRLERRPCRRQPGERGTLELGSGARRRMNTHPTVTLENVTKRYGGVTALESAISSSIRGDPCACRRERRGKVDIVQAGRGRDLADGGPVERRWPAGRLLRAEGR